MPSNLIRVIYVGNATPGDQTGEIRLASGPLGEPRTLAIGGSNDDALVTVDELNMLTSQFQIAVHEEQPELTEEEVEAQTPALVDPSFGGAVPATVPPHDQEPERTEEDDAGIPEAPEDVAPAEATPVEEPASPAVEVPPAPPQFAAGGQVTQAPVETHPQAPEQTQPAPAESLQPPQQPAGSAEPQAAQQSPPTAPDESPTTTPSGQ